MHATPIALLAAAVLAAPAWASAQRVANPNRSYLNLRLEAQPDYGLPLAAFADFSRIDSVVILELDDDTDEFVRVGASVVTRSDGRITLDQRFDDGSVAIERRLSGPVENPADGLLTLAETYTESNGSGEETFEFTHTATFAGGQMQASSQEDLYSVVPTADRSRYYYDAEQRLVARADRFGIPGFETKDDSTVYRYEVDGAEFVQDVHGSEDDDDGDYPEDPTSRFTFVRAAEDLLIAHFEGDFGGGTLEGTARYRFRDGILDTFVFEVPGFEAFAAGASIIRSDDGSQPNVIAYDFGGDDRLVYYYDGPALPGGGGGGNPPDTSSAVGRLPALAVDLAIPNPVSPGDAYAVTGDLPAGAALRITTLDGRVLAEADPTAPAQWPVLGGGPFLVTVAAPGWRPHTEVVVSAGR